MLAQPPLAKRPLPRISRRDPVVHGARNNPYRVGGFGLLSNRDQEFGAVTLLWVSEGLNLIQRRFVQMDMLAESGHVAWLLADDFCRRVLHDSGAVLVRLIGGADEVFRRLADAPNARVALARCAEELDHDTGQNRRFKKRPALVEQNDARL